MATKRVLWRMGPQVAVPADVRADPLSLLKPPLWSEDIRIVTPNLLVAGIQVEPRNSSRRDTRSTYRL